MSENRDRVRRILVLVFSIGLLALVSASGEILPGARCAILTGDHIDQDEIDDEQISFSELVNSGALLFAGNLSGIPGFGSGVRTGFNPLRGPDSLSCTACHNQITTPSGLITGLAGGAGDNTSNIFNGTTSSTSIAGANERNTPHIFGVGALEKLAEEMSEELQSLEEAAVDEALDCRCTVLKELTSKGVDFGWVIATPSGSLERGGIDGVDSDLQIKPFTQKGTTEDLRTFSVDPMTRHHGLQAVEEFGSGTDPDRDGVTDELSIGDITALALFQATRPAPQALKPSDLDQIEQIESGERIFELIGCAQCHIPELTLEEPIFQMTSPLDSEREIDFDLTATLGLETTFDGKAVVPLYGDLRRHDMGFELSDPQSESGVSSSLFMTAELWGVASTPPYLHDGRAATLTEAIEAHRGEAQSARNSFMGLSSTERAKLLDFLGSLVIEPEHVGNLTPDCN